MQKQLMMVALGATAMMSAPVLGENFDLSFKGGTVKEYYNALQETAAGIRLVVHPDVDLFMMPAVDLPDMTEWAAVRVAAELIDGIEADYIPSEVGDTPWDGATFVVSVQAGYVELELERAKRFDLDFEGGSLDSFVRALREVGDANVVLQPEAAGLPVPPMVLRGADVHNVLLTFESSFNSPRRGTEEPQLDLEWIKTSKDENSLYMIGLESARAESARKGPERVRYWSLGSVIERSTITAADILGTIEVAQEFFDDEVAVGYHEPTRVLIVKGNERDLVAINELLDSITESSHSMEQGR